MIKSFYQPTIKKIEMSKQVSNQEDKEIRYKNKTISKRKDGRWWVRLYRDHKQLSIYGKTGAECLANLKKELALATTVKKTLTLNDWAELWQKMFKGSWKNGTRKKFENIYAKYFKKSIGNLDLSKISTFVIQEFLSNIKAPRQRDNCFMYLKDMLNKAKKNEKIKKDPFDNVDFKKSKSKESKALNKMQEEFFIKQIAEDTYADIFYIILYEGLRPGEVRALSSDDIDIENKRLKVDKTYDDTGCIGSTKGGKTRFVPIFDKALNIFTRLKALNRQQLFSIADTNISKHFHLAYPEAKKNYFTVYSLRHTCITRWAEQGIHPNVCKEWAGHSDVQITLKYYTHINKEWLDINIEKVNFDTHFDT